MKDAEDRKTIMAAVEAASEFMNKHHAALDVVNEAIILLNHGKLNEARDVLIEFQKQWDSGEVDG